MTRQIVSLSIVKSIATLVVSCHVDIRSVGYFVRSRELAGVKKVVLLSVESLEYAVL